MSILQGQGSEVSNIMCENGSAFLSGECELFGICCGQLPSVTGRQDINIAVGEDARE
jgi:hypothetical protein